MNYLSSSLITPLVAALVATPLAAQGGPDCNGNGIPDADDLANGTSTDCNADGVPDECVACRLDIVFIMDTSDSMDDEGAALCMATDTIEADLAARGIDLSVARFSINRGSGFGGGSNSPYSCLAGNTVDTPAGASQAGAFEDWGPATEQVAESHSWRIDALRVVVPITDEGPFRGTTPGGCNDPGNDRDSIDDAIAACLQNDVTAFPILGSGIDSCAQLLAEDLAAGTGGRAFLPMSATANITGAIQSLIQGTCFAAFDCNDNGIFDTCEFVPYGTGKPGTFGVPRLAASGCLRAGGTFTVTLDRAPAGSIACLYFGAMATSVPFLDATLLVAPPMQGFFSPMLVLDPATGQGQAVLNLPIPIQLAGSSLFAQAGLTDQGAPLGFSMTQGLELRISN